MHGGTAESSLFAFAPLRIRRGATGLLAWRMSYAPALPEWLPWWLPIVVLVPALLYALVFLVMPFNVLGLKGRLDLLDARLDEIQGEIRLLTLRLPEALHDPGEVSEPVAAGRSRPPIPPGAGSDPERRAAAVQPGRGVLARDAVRNAEEAENVRRRQASRPSRAEPRVDWPRQ